MLTFLGMCWCVEECERPLAARRRFDLSASPPRQVELHVGRPARRTRHVPEYLHENDEWQRLWKTRNNTDIYKTNAPVKSNIFVELHFSKQKEEEISIFTGKLNLKRRKDEKCLFTHLNVYNRDMNTDRGEMIYFYTTCNTSWCHRLSAVCTRPVMSRLYNCYIQHQLHTDEVYCQSEEWMCAARCNCRVKSLNASMQQHAKYCDLIQDQS